MNGLEFYYCYFKRSQYLPTICFILITFVSIPLLPLRFHLLNKKCICQIKNWKSLFHSTKLKFSSLKRRPILVQYTCRSPMKYLNTCRHLHRPLQFFCCWYKSTQVQNCITWLGHGLINSKWYQIQEAWVDYLCCQHKLFWMC